MFEASIVDALKSVDSEADGTTRHALQQLGQMYMAALGVDEPTILELGVDKGQSTRIFLDACEEKNGLLVSVDIRDCSSACASPRWTFVRSDSTDVTAILDAAPQLRSGINILYVDSLHKVEHVEKEVFGWWPYLKENSLVFFDDVDSCPYRSGGRKDDFITEVCNDEILEFVRCFFEANANDTDLSLVLGSTGLAVLKKRSPLGASATRCPINAFHRRRVWGGRIVNNVLEMAKTAFRG